MKDLPFLQSVRDAHAEPDLIVRFTEGEAKVVLRRVGGVGKPEPGGPLVTADGRSAGGEAGTALETEGQGLARRAPHPEFPVKPKPLRVTQVGGEGKDVAILFKEVDVAGGGFSIDLCAAHRHQPEAETAE